MKKSFVVLILFLSFSASCYAEDDFSKTPLGKELVSLGLKFLDDPGDFFFNLHSQNEDFSPVASTKRGDIRMNVLPTTLPLTWGNLNFKVKVLDDEGWLPQIDLVGMYGDLIGLRLASNSLSDVKPEFVDYSYGAVLSKNTDEDTKIFGGLKFSTVQMKVTLSSSSIITFGDFKIEQLDFKFQDSFAFTGLMHKTGPDRYIVAQAGYGFTYKKIVARVMVSKKHLQYGIDVFPEGLFVFHPFLAYHWNF